MFLLPVVPTTLLSKEIEEVYASQEKGKLKVGSNISFVTLERSLYYGEVIKENDLIVIDEPSLAFLQQPCLSNCNEEERNIVVSSLTETPPFTDFSHHIQLNY